MLRPAMCYPARCVRLLTVHARTHARMPLLAGGVRCRDQRNACSRMSGHISMELRCDDVFPSARAPPLPYLVPTVMRMTLGA